MINQKRVKQLEVSLTSRCAVTLWLRQEFQGKTFLEYSRWLIRRPVTAAPRIRVARQVVAAIQADMKGQDPVQIQHAARQAHMETDFLILLVNRANSVVCDHIDSGWLRIGSFSTRLSTAGLRDEEASDDLAADLRTAATELFSIQLAVEHIRARYFNGECILAKDVEERLNLPTMLLRYFIADLDRHLEKHGNSELVVDSEEFRSVVAKKTSKKVLYICALAKSEMLHHFGRGEEANSILRPYVLGDQ